MSSPRPAVPKGTWRISRAGGFDVLVSPSLLVMGAALVLLFSRRFDGLSTDPLVLAIAFVVGLYVSVLVHELAHVAAARLYDMRVIAVRLHVLGGETAIEGDSRTPGQELVVAGIGPLTSAVIGAFCLTAHGVTGGSLAEVLWAVGWVNVVVAAFNLVPGLPLDGGRVLRAIVWAVTGREALGIVIAAWIGRLTGVAVLAWFATRPLDGAGYLIELAMAVLVAGFLWLGATQALRSVRRSPLTPEVPR